MGVKLKGIAISLLLVLLFTHTTFAQTGYYLKSVGNVELLGSWGTNTDGSGASPTSFSANNQVFNIVNQAAPTIGASWSVSGTGSSVVIGDGVAATTLDIGAYNLTAPLVVTGNAKLRISSTGVYSGTLTSNLGSEVVFSGANQTVNSGPYYNLTIQGTGVKTLAGAITVNGNLTVASGVTLSCGVSQITGNTSGLLTLGSGATLNLGSSTQTTNTLFPTNFTRSNIQLDPTSWVVYTNSAVQTVSDEPVYGGLRVFNGTKTLSGSNPTVSIVGDLDIPWGGNVFSLGTSDKEVTIGGRLTGNGNLNMSGSANSKVILYGDYTNAGTLTPGTGTFTYGGAGAQQVRALTYYNLGFSGGGVKTVGNGDIVANGSLSVDAASTLRYNSTTARIITVAGDFSVLGTLDMSSMAHQLYLNGANNTIATLLSNASSTVRYGATGNQQVASSNAYANLSITGSGNKTMGGDVKISGVATFSAGSLILNGYTLTLGGTVSGTATTIVGGGTSNLAIVSSGAAITLPTITGGVNDFTINKTGTSANVTLSSDLAIAGTATFTAGSLNLNGKVLSLNGATSVGAATVVGSTTSSLAVASASNASMQLPVVTGGLSSISLSKTGTDGRVLLGSAIALSGNLTLSSGLLVLGSYDLTINSTAGSILGAPSSSAYIVANGAGQLKKLFGTTPTLGFVFPVGDAASYSPVTLDMTANSANQTVGINVVASKHPNDASTTNYLGRYWNFTATPATSYTYNATFDFSPADVNGTASSVSVNRWDGSRWVQYTTAGARPPMSISGVTQLIAPLNGSSYTARVNGPSTYTWVGATNSSWQTPSSWSPARLSPQPDDILQFLSAGTIAATNVPTQTVSQLIIGAGSTITLTPATTSDVLTLSGVTGSGLSIVAGSTLNLGGTNSLGLQFTSPSQNINIDGNLTLVNGSYNATNTNTRVGGSLTLTKGGITSTPASLQVSAGGTYVHNLDGSNLPAATWDVASTCKIQGTKTVAPTGLNQNFGNLTFACAGLTAPTSATLTGDITISGNLAIGGTSATNLLTLQSGAYSCTVLGATSINAYGVFDDNTSGGSNSFGGAVSILANGLLSTSTIAPATNTSSFTFGGVVSNSGKITVASNASLTFNSTLVNSGTMTIAAGFTPTVTTIGLLTNNSTFTITNSGNGTFNFGDISNSGTITLGGACVSNFNGSTTNANILTVSSSGATNFQGIFINNKTYTHSGTGVLNFYGGITNNSIFTKSGGGLTTFAANQDLNGTTVISINSGDILVADGVTVNKAVDISFGGGNLNFGAGASLNASSGTFTFAATSAQNISGATAGTVNFFNLTANKGGVKNINIPISIQGALNLSTNSTFLMSNTAPYLLTIGGLVSVGSGSTLNLGSVTNSIKIGGATTMAGLLQFSGTVSNSVELGGNLTLSGAIDMTGSGHVLTLLGVSNTVTGTGALRPVTPAVGSVNSLVRYAGSSDQTIFTSPNYQMLEVTGGGIKTLTGTTTIVGNLLLNGAVVELANYNLSLTNASATSISTTAVFDASNMISTNGTGRLLKYGSSLAHYQIVYPVGGGGYYSPMEITSLGTIPSYLRIGAIPKAINSSYMKKYWELYSTVNLANVTATFYYNHAELNGALQSVSYSTNNGTTWQNPPASGVLSFASGSFTVTGTTPFAGGTTSLWTLGNRTYYSYKTGDWSDPTTWTSDPSGALQIGTTIPDINDKVVILQGRTVSLSSSITTSNLDITISYDGVLDMKGFAFTKTLVALSGQGTLKLASNQFPAITTNNFVAANTGTVEYNAPITLPTQATYNNLAINTTGVVVQALNLTINGNLNVKSGTFQINDNSSTKRSLLINGSVNVDASGAIVVGTGATNTVTTNFASIAAGGTAPFTNYYSQGHQVTIYGDFINKGNVRFTNLAYPVYDAFPSTTASSNTGFATVVFTGTTSNTVQCDGVTDFYNLIVNKGTDQSLTLTVNSSGYKYFKLFGPNIAPAESATLSTANQRKALWIRNGTLVLQGLITIPSLSEGVAANSGYVIASTAGLTLDNPNATVLATADDYKDVNAAYGVAGGTGLVNGVSQNSNSWLQVFGTLTVNTGYLSTRESSGIVYSSPMGQIFVEGGTLDAKQIVSLGGASDAISINQSGGTILLRGRLQASPAQYTSALDLQVLSPGSTRANASFLNAASGSLSLNANSVFAQSAGTLRVIDVPDPTTAKALDIKVTTANANISGGTIEFLSNASSEDGIAWITTSMAPFANLSLNRATGAAAVKIEAGYPLTILQNAMLTSGTFDANSQDVTIGGDFVVSSSASYTTGVNSTIFNGADEQKISLFTAAPLSFSTMKVDKAVGSVLTFGGTQTTINVQNALLLNLATLKDNGNTINVYGNIYNSGKHSGIGKIVLAGDAAQSIDGDGKGIFENLELNKPSSGVVLVTALNNFTVNGKLTFSGAATGYKRLYLQGWNLKMNATASFVGADQNRYVLTDGQVGNGGITKLYSSSATSFTFPLATVHTTQNYTPATIALGSAPTAYGSITVTPVKSEHPVTTTKNISLKYFWRVKSDGFTGVPSNSVNLSFSYQDEDVAGTESQYFPARFDYLALAWTYGTAASVNSGLNTIGSPWLASFSVIDGDYTAGGNGTTNPFGSPQKYYSRNTGLWSDKNTWSLTNNSNHSPALNAPITGAVPGVNDIVVIGGNQTVSLYTPPATIPSSPTSIGGAANYYELNKKSVQCAVLQIEAGATLDVGNNPSSYFGMVFSSPLGNGTFRLATSYNDQSTYQFPGGDFTEFNKQLGTTELYSVNPLSGTTYWLPNGVASYGNLVLSPLGGSNIIFGNGDLMVYGDLITKGQNADSWFCPTWNTPYPTTPFAVVPKTITIKGNLDIQGGGLVWYGNGALSQDFVVYGNVIVAPKSSIVVWGGATNQSLKIGGSLINNTLGTIVAPATQTTSSCNFNSIALTFFGSGKAYFTSSVTTSVTNLWKVTLDKGSSLSDSLIFDINGVVTTSADWLTLKNGVFKYAVNEPSADFSLSNNVNLNVPATAGIHVEFNNAIGNKSVLIGNGGADLLLNGALTLAKGNLNIGSTTATGTGNDIEYAGGGHSSINIAGGRLLVKGQIRRAISNSVGVLNYNQTGGDVYINGNSGVKTNASLEVLNPGSSFNMSGGTLTLISGGNNTFADMYLRPESGSVVGGDIRFIPYRVDNVAWTTGATTYYLESNISLNNVEVADATGKTTLKLTTSPLVVNGNMKLTRSNSYLDASNRNVTVNGDWTNNGTFPSYIYGTNTTTFGGNTQSVGGTAKTYFNNLVINSSNSLTFADSSTVYGNLSIAAGNVILNDRTIRLKGDLSNNGAYTNDFTNHLGGLLLIGKKTQGISGNGSFGQLELSNAVGANVTSSINFVDNLIMTNGSITIGSNLLSLSTNSSLLGAPFSINKMIITDGAITSKGLRKYFAPFTTTTAFSYPVGVAGKYTNVELSLTKNDQNGYLTIYPVNKPHQSVLDPSRVLKYYWEVETSGLTNFGGNMLFQYIEGDIQGDETKYVRAVLMRPGDVWSKAMLGPNPDDDGVLESLHQITYSISDGVNNITGAYTAGEADAIPNTIPTFRSNSDGAWTDPSIWDPVGSTAVCPAGGPNGFNVIVDNTVTISSNNASAYTTTLNGQLKVLGSTFGHNLGEVTGGGKLYVEGGVLPAGNFDSFLSCATGGTLEYGGNSDYVIVTSLYSSIPNIIFSGSGSRILPNKDLTICNRLVIDDQALLSLSSAKLTILGTMERYNSGAFSSGTSRVVFAGNAQQTLGGALGNFVSPDASFYDLEIDNLNGLILNGPVDVADKLYLTNGTIGTTTANILRLNNPAPDAVSVSGLLAPSFVDGPLRKWIGAGSYFQYPLGKGNVQGHPFTVLSTGSKPLYWNAEFFTPNSTASSKASPLQVVNGDEYWSVVPDEASTAQVRVGWDSKSDITPLMVVGGVDGMRVVQYNGGSSLWEERSSTYNGNDNLGYVTTFNDIAFTTTPEKFTSGCVPITLARASLNPPRAYVCGTEGIPVKFVAHTPVNPPYLLQYEKNGVLQPTVTLTTLSYLIPTTAATVAETYKLVSFKSDNGSTDGVVDPSIITVNPTPTTAVTGSAQAICSLTGTKLTGNAPTVGVGHWTIVSGIGGTIYNSNSPISDFSGIMGQVYTLRWTISSGAGAASCKSSADLLVSFNVGAQQPADFTSAVNNVCVGTGGYVYTVPVVPGTSYTWSFTGTGETIVKVGAGNSATVDFSGSATSGTISITAVNGCSAIPSPPRSIVVTVNPNPSVTIAPLDQSVCAGGTLAVSATPSGGSGIYTNKWVGTASGYLDATTGLTSNFSSTNPGTYTLQSQVTDSKGCKSAASTSVVVLAAPSLTWDATTEDKGCAGGTTYLRISEGGLTYSWAISDPYGSFSSTGSQDNTIQWLGNSAIFGPGQIQKSGKVTVTATNSNGCIATVDKDITIFRRPETGQAYHIDNNAAK